MNWKQLLAVSAMGALSATVYAGFKLNVYVPCLLKEYCTAYVPTQGELVDNGAEPWFYPVQGTDYGTVVTAYPQVRQFIASNIGTGDLTVYGFSRKNGTAPFEYVKSDCPMDGTFVLKPGAACTVNVKFAPPTASEYTDTLVLLHSSTIVPAVEKDVRGVGIEMTPDQIEAEKDKLEGGSAGVVPKEDVPQSPVTPEEARRGLRLSTSVLDFGKVPQGSTVAAQSVQLFNDTDEPLHPYAIRARRDNVVNITQNCFPEIPAKGSCTVSATLLTAETTIPALSSAIEVKTSESVDGTVGLLGEVMGAEVVASPNPLKVTATSGTEEAASTITLSNIGNDTATISDVGLSATPSGFLGGANFVQKSRITQQSCGAVLAPKTSCTIEVSYKSATEGADLGEIVYKVNGVTQRVPVQAKMILPDLQIIGDGHDYGAVTMGTTAVKTMTVKNIGDKTVTVKGVDYASPFLRLKNNQCTSPLNIGDQCTFDLEFVGDVLNQRYKDHPFAVLNDGDLASIPAKVRGFSTGGYLKVDVPDLDFRRVEYKSTARVAVFTVSNEGDQTVKDLSVAQSDPRFLMVRTSGTDCRDVTQLIAGMSCSFGVMMDSSVPTSGQVIKSVISVAGDATNTKSPLTFQASGEVVGGILKVEPASINFGSVPYGSLQVRQVTVTNTGVRPLKLTGLGTTGSRAMFVQDTTCLDGTVLQPNGTCQITIKMVTTLDGKEGAYLGVTIGSDAANGSSGVNAQGTPVGSWLTTTTPTRVPDTRVGTTGRYGVTFANNAYTPLKITNAKLTATDGSTWQLITNTCTAVYQQQCNIVFDVTPSVYGTMGATLDVSTNDPRYPSYTVPIEGSAYSGGPNIVLEGKIVSSYDAGSMSFGETKVINGAIVNKGDQSITVKSINGPGWNVTGCANAVLAANASCPIQLSSTMPETSDPAVRVNTITATFTNADNRAVAISATPYGAVATLSKTSFDFGNQVYHVQRNTTFTITNTGVTPLMFSGAWTTDPNKEFTISDNCGLTIARAASCTVTVSFAPEAEDARSMVFQRASNSIDARSGVISFKADGFGLVGKPVVLATIAGTPGTTKTVPMSVINKGNGGIVVQSLTLPNGSAYNATVANPNNCSAIPSYGVCTYNLTVTIPAGSPEPLKAKLVFTGGPSPVETPIVASDDTVALSCSAIKAEYPDAPTGVYLLNKWGTVQQVYCDQETDGGGWELAYVNSYELATANPSHPIKFISYGSFAKGGTLVTGSASPAMPALPNGYANDFNRALIKGGTTAWRGVVGEWVSFDTLTNGSRIDVKYPNARSDKGVTTLAAGAIGWGVTTVPNAEEFSIGPAYGANPMCGGGGWAVSKNCMTMNVVGSWIDGYPYHYEVRSYREIYFRY